MKMKKLEAKVLANSIKSDIDVKGNVKITIDTAYSELVNVIMLTQMFSNNIDVRAKSSSLAKPFKLGVFTIRKIVIDGDGTAKVIISSTIDFSETDNLKNLVVSDDEIISIRFFTEIELEEGE